MRTAKPVWLPLIAVLGSLVVATGELRTQSIAAASRPAPETTLPNVVFVLVDDMMAREFELGFGRSVPGWTSALVTELYDQGTVFDNLFNSTPLCCPSRASYLTGQYSHNNGIWANNYDLTEPPGNGGWKRFWELGRDDDSLGKWMQDAGYETVLIGKFLNGYPDRPGRFLPEEHVPAGWHEWYGTFTNDAPFSYYEFRINENGTVVEYGVEEPAYLTDVERDHAVDFIDRIAPTGQPFFIYLSPFAPHGPTEAAERHKGSHAHVVVEPPPSFNEQDLSDKPQHIQDGAEPFVRYLGGGFRRKLDMSLALDELIQAVIDALRDNGVLDQTYVILTSDNGLLNGEHQIAGKSAPYEESIRVPLVARGPGIPTGVTRQHMLLNVDVAPTLLDLAGVPPPASVDGESLLGVLTGIVPIQDWRQGVLIELLTPIGPTPEPDPLSERLRPLGPESNQPVTIPPYGCYRSAGHIYCEYEPGDLELYDLIDDPYELESLHLTASSELIAALKEPLDALRNCAADDCRSAARLPAPNARPRVGFTVTCDSLECEFDGSDTVDLDGDISELSWDFGDGSGAIGESVTQHTFPEGADYTVTLTATDDDGETNSAAQLVATTSELCASEFELFDESEGTRVVYRASGSIVARDYTVVAPSGDVTFIAAEAVDLGAGFRVEAGARLQLITDPTAGCE